MFPNKRIYFKYRLLLKEDALPLNINDVKNHLRLDCLDGQENYINLLITAVSDFAEKYTGLTLINKTFVTLRDNFSTIQLRKKPFQGLVSLEYLTNNIFNDVPVDLYNVFLEDDFAFILLNEGKSWPDDKDSVPESVRITFTSGFGDSYNDIPADLQLAMLNHLAFLYENRGDCNQSNQADKLPAMTKEIYQKYWTPDL